MVKILEVLTHLIKDILDRNVDFLHDSLINISNDLLNDFELLEQFPAGFEDILRENVLFTIDPQVREAFLGRVKDFCQVAERALLVQDFVCLGELLTILPGCTDCLESFAESFDLVEEPLACSLSILRIEVIFFIWSLFQVVTHHNRVLQE